MRSLNMAGRRPRFSEEACRGRELVALLALSMVLLIQPARAWAQCPTCGNGILEVTEQCDDANTTSGDGCAATCQLELPAGCVVVTASQYNAAYGTDIAFKTMLLRAEALGYGPTLFSAIRCTIGGQTAYTATLLRPGSQATANALVIRSRAPYPDGQASILYRRINSTQVDVLLPTGKIRVDASVDPDNPVHTVFDDFGSIVLPDALLPSEPCQAGRIGYLKCVAAQTALCTGCTLCAARCALSPPTFLYCIPFCAPFCIGCVWPCTLPPPCGAFSIVQDNACHMEYNYVTTSPLLTNVKNGIVAAESSLQGTLLQPDRYLLAGMTDLSFAIPLVATTNRAQFLSALSSLTAEPCESHPNYWTTNGCSFPSRSRTLSQSTLLSAIALSSGGDRIRMIVYGVPLESQLSLAPSVASAAQAAGVRIDPILPFPYDYEGSSCPGVTPNRMAFEDPAYLSNAQSTGGHISMTEEYETFEQFIKQAVGGL